MITFSSKKNFQFNEDWLDSTLTEWATTLEQELRTDWEAERDPTTGARWAPLSKRYQKWKIDHYGSLPKLILSGRLLTTTRVAKVGKQIVVDMPAYGMYHQLGTSKMPSRPFLGIPDRTLKQLATISFRNIFNKR
ncbi:putative tail completion and stable head joining protein [Synechococcus phage S-CBWM1]|uniref:Putative tail completion and stable head joining protein n=1 Tax=Synechococcus phage S-CBWM1 TaxID=2053653 RepID=A0A3G1L3K6_9CAUD|nr:tail completion or Neck1 protein [Synechococcus phage S-CBWM1]ATW62765.1 putative tail completion and stable head joining protein [Synechococcus phage S-CBWM1]